MHITKKIWLKIPDTVRIAIFIFTLIVPMWIILTLSIRKFLGNFEEGLLVEAFGMILDILIIGIIILWLNEKRAKKLNIQRWREEIDDYRNWDEDEAKYRIVGNIKRLNKMGITDIDLSYCYLEDTKLGKDPYSLVDSTEAQATITDLIMRTRERLVISDTAKKKEWIASLEGATLIKTCLQGANLFLVNLQKANLYGADLQGADLLYTRLDKANLRRANLQNASLGLAALDGANLINANLLGARDLKIDQLSKVESLYEAKLDPELRKEIEENYPLFLEAPKSFNTEQD